MINTLIKSKKALRSIHFNKQNGICAYCGCCMNQRKTDRDDFSVTLEHIFPQTMGGRDTEANTIAICYRCNQNRGCVPLGFDLMWNIFVLKGVDAFEPIGQNLWLFVKTWVGIRSRHAQMFSLVFF